MARKKTVKSETTDLAQPQTRTEEFLAKIAGLVDTLPQGEFSRLERYLKYIAENGGGGGGGVTSFNSRTGAVVPESGDYSAEQVGAAPAVEDTTYVGCYKRTVGGVTEWINPPLIAETEYRTIERFAGKPVYAKAFSITEAAYLPTTGTTKNNNLVITNLDQIVSVTATAQWTTGANTVVNAALPYLDHLRADAYSVSNGSKYLALTAGSSFPNSSTVNSVFAVVKYTKSTD